MGSHSTTPRVINGRYELIEALAPGGMGTVYRAFDRQAGQDVYLKILDGDHPVAPSRLQRFKTELRRTPGLVPPGAREVYDLGLEEHGLLFLTLACEEAGGKAPESISPVGRAAWLDLLAEAPGLDAVLAHALERVKAARGLLQLLDEDGRVTATACVGELREVENVSRAALERVRYERTSDRIAGGGQMQLCLPLRAGDALVGTLWAEGPEGLLGESLLAELALDLTLALRKDAAVVQAEENTRHLEMLNALSRTVSSTLDLDTILTLVLSQSLEVCDAEQGALFWGEERLATLDRFAQPVPDLRVSQSVLAQVLSTGTSLSILDTLEDERFATQASIMDLQLRSIMGVPLHAGNATRGVLYVSSQSVNKAFGPRDLEILEAIAGQVSLAIENARAYQTIRELNAGLEETVLKRTAQLRTTQAQLVQSEKMASLGQMVAGVAHELNNPLNFIFGNLKVLREYVRDLLALVGLYDQGAAPAAIKAHKQTIDFDYLAADLEKTIDSCLTGTTRSQKIVSDLKLFSGHDEAELKPIDLAAGVESAIAMVQGRFAGRVAFATTLAALPPINAYGRHLNQAFLAILTNAGQAIAQTGTVTVSLAAEDDLAVLTVRDDGVGIAPEHLPKIFDPFFTTRAVGDGTGLGLTTAFAVVERHGGHLAAASVLGEGTTIRLTLPLAGVSASA